jgi:cell division septation protein DedD
LSTKNWTIPSGSGTKTVYLQIKDNAGLVSSTFSDTIILDTTAPTGSIVINAGDAYATSTSVTLTLTYSDSGSGVSQVRYSNDGTWDAETWESASATKAWTLTSGDGTKTVYYQVKDNVGLLSSTYSDTIVLDTIIPTGSITINNGDTSTTSTDVTLTLTYSDGGSGVNQVRFSNDGTWDTKTWENPSATKAWILTSGDGAKTVYYQIKDNAGLTSSYSATITLQSPTPTPTPTPTATPAPTNPPSATPTPTPKPLASPTPSPTPSASPSPSPSPTASATPTPQPASTGFPVEYVFAIVGLVAAVIAALAVLLLRKKKQRKL